MFIIKIRWQKNRGFTLIEILIAMILGLLLVSFLLEMFVTSQQNYKLQFVLQDVRNNARAALDVLKSDISQAGYIGCPRLTSQFNVQPYQSYSLSAQTKLTGNADELSVRRAAFPSVQLKQVAPQKTWLVIGKEIQFAAGDLLIISDCEHAEIFQAKHVSIRHDSQRLILTEPLKNEYDSYAEISRLQINRYFIANTKRKNSDGSFIQALYVQDYKNHKTELVENVKRMQVNYVMHKGENGLNKVSTNMQDASLCVGVEIALTFVTSILEKTWYLYVSLLAE